MDDGTHLTLAPARFIHPWWDYQLPNRESLLLLVYHANTQTEEFLISCWDNNMYMRKMQQSHQAIHSWTFFYCFLLSYDQRKAASNSNIFFITTTSFTFTGSADQQETEQWLCLIIIPQILEIGFFQRSTLATRPMSSILNYYIVPNNMWGTSLSETSPLG